MVFWITISVYCWIGLNLYVAADDSASWDFVNAIEFWEDEHVNGDNESEQDDYVLVRQEDIVDGIASFMAAYLLSLKQTKVRSLLWNSLFLDDFAQVAL